MASVVVGLFVNHEGSVSDTREFFRSDQGVLHVTNLVDEAALQSLLGVVDASIGETADRLADCTDEAVSHVVL